MAADASGDGSQDLQLANASTQSHTADTGRSPGPSRLSYPESSAPWRQHTRPAFQTAPGHSYSRTSSSDTQQGPSGLGSRYTGAPQPFQTRGAPYAQPSGYGGQYTLSPQPAGNLQPPPSGAFPYGPGFSHHGQYVHETPMIPQNAHMAYPSANMPSLMHHHSSPGPSSMYVHSQAAPSPPSRSPLSSPSSQGPHSASYSGSASFYPSPLSASSFPYPAQPFSPSTPIYQSPYSSPSYPPQFISPGEQEGQGTWWYVPSNVPSPNQYDPMSHTYQAHYAVPYASLNRQEFEGYRRPGPQSVSSAGYPVSSPLPQASMGQPHVFGPGHESASPSLIYPTSPGPASSEVSAASARAASNLSSARRAYHPNPPAHRSEWVMWVGNVPGDATVEELWRVFNQPRPLTQSPDSDSKESDAEGQLYGGVVSIYPIVRSNCAFVNFESEAHLHSAIARFNGQQLRSHDPKCPRLVCRVRAKEDDLRAGVGAQRGTGVHTRWVRERRARDRERKEEGEEEQGGAERRSASPAESPRGLAQRLASLSLGSEEEGRFRRGTKKSSSGSYASTNSSFLARHFPKRYFILKSLTQFDLDLSVEKGLWATQRHNETILDQAYRTSRDVYLIFGVNKSGEFYGYARMASPILRGEERISWASRTDASPASLRGQRRSEPILEEGGSPTQARPTFLPLSEHRLVDESPLPLSPPHKQILPSAVAEAPREFLSAPAEMNQPHHRFSFQAPAPKPSLDVPRVLPAAPSLFGADKFELKEGPVIAARARGKSGSSSKSSKDSKPDSEGVKRMDMLMDEYPGSPLRTVAEEGSKEDLGEEEPEEEAKPGKFERAGENWGEPFRIEWIQTTRLPFWRTRHLRNPWNHEREVKVSRDGTELEPSVGQALLDEWERPEPPQSPVSFKYPGQGRRPTGEPKSASTNTAPTLSRKGDM
ncbi:hypothetical protein OE88DRAFT_1734362 [Heliocybe sulcata]|uniref:YTH domain-containing protein n=1 Tax=Heliocybe sulcata TaxID=5364 RepID=A0A5C3N4Z0_9AGAM|nr:hypothetical protein OE88DRAFT_1734362 [Heliocybe sulcata]